MESWPGNKSKTLQATTEFQFATGPFDQSSTNRSQNQQAIVEWAFVAGTITHCYPKLALLLLKPYLCLWQQRRHWRRLRNSHTKTDLRQWCLPAHVDGREKCIHSNIYILAGCQHVQDLVSRTTNRWQWEKAAIIVRTSASLPTRLKQEVLLFSLRDAICKSYPTNQRSDLPCTRTYGQTIKVFSRVIQMLTSWQRKHCTVQSLALRLKAVRCDTNNLPKFACKPS